jgi:hypothetical protein
MKTIHQCSLVVLLTIALIPASVTIRSEMQTAARGAPMSPDETAIRELIARYDRGERFPTTTDLVQYSSAYKKPAKRGGPPPEEVPSDRMPSDRKPGSQRNHTTPERIEIAKSGDLAYEFSNGNVTFEMKDGRKVELPLSLLRVWRKEEGQWKAAAWFSVRHYEENRDRK